MAKINIADAEVPGIDIKAPISVKDTSPLIPPINDYTPNKAKLAETARPVKTIKGPTGDVNYFGSDYAPAAVAEKIRSSQNERVKVLAQQIWDEDKDYREKYNAARLLYESPTATEKDSDKWKAAEQVILTKRPPLSKADAMARAKAYLAGELKASSEIKGD